MICKGVLEPAKLQLTERAAHYHGLHVHLQVSAISLNLHRTMTFCFILKR